MKYAIQRIDNGAIMMIMVACDTGPGSAYTVSYWDVLDIKQILQERLNSGLRVRPLYIADKEGILTEAVKESVEMFRWDKAPFKPRRACPDIDFEVNEI